MDDKRKSHVQDLGKSVVQIPETTLLELGLEPWVVRQGAPMASERTNKGECRNETHQVSFPPSHAPVA